MSGKADAARKESLLVWGRRLLIFSLTEKRNHRLTTFVGSDVSFAASIVDHSSSRTLHCRPNRLPVTGIIPGLKFFPTEKGGPGLPVTSLPLAHFVPLSKMVYHQS